MGRPSYKQAFDRLYEQSSPEARALFDNPSTRESVPELYNAWKKSQGKSVSRSRDLNIEAEARASVYRELDDFLWFCEFMGEAAEGEKR